LNEEKMVGTAHPTGRKIEDVFEPGRVGRGMETGNCLWFYVF
jgi:hypothetical protein